MTATDPVQAVAEAMHADLCPDDECDGGDMGEWERQAEVAVAAARPLIAAVALREAADWIEAHPENLDCEAEASGIAANRLRFRADDLEAGR